MKRILIILISLMATAYSGMTTEEIIYKAESQMRGNTSYMKMSIIIKNDRWDRNIQLESWSEGTKKSFIKIIYPEKDKGVTFLKLNTDMWQYIPKIERTIKYPPSMMLQSWMGTDFSNDDLVKESSIVNDYDKKMLSEDENSYTIELMPRPDSSVTWGKIIEYIDKKTMLPVWAKFYDEDGVLIRSIKYENVVKLQDRFFPKKWIVEPGTDDKKGNLTIMTIENMSFNNPLPQDIFTLKSLIRRSR
ncbi:MAG: hypothetical protein A2Y40_08065 [Candidatus Margulisbacteria bacterium GWF2_35_9]|nr:MAG: hypothetical protein A2Y40_08065 [Candidatus Margulisbacteria bacterium GWF2_35_9]